MKRPLFFIAILISQFGFAAPEIKGNPEDLRSFLHPSGSIITLTDKAEETAYSDEAIVNVVVTTEAQLLSTSIEKNTNLRNQVMQALIQQGIAPNNINNSKFSSSPQYGWFGKKPDSYKVVNRIAIRINSEAHLLSIAKLSDTHQEITLSSTVFEHSEKTTFEKKVKQKALNNVLLQKKAYESALGIKLIPVSVHEGQAFAAATEGAYAVEEVIVQGLRKEKSTLSSRNYSDEARPSNSFDEVKYQATVSVDFKVVP